MQATEGGGIPRFADFAPLGLVRRFVEMLLQAGISPCVGRNDGRGGALYPAPPCDCPTKMLCIFAGALFGGTKGGLSMQSAVRAGQSLSHFVTAPFTQGSLFYVIPNTERSGVEGSPCK